MHGLIRSTEEWSRPRHSKWKGKEAEQQHRDFPSLLFCALLICQRLMRRMGCSSRQPAVFPVLTKPGGPSAKVNPNSTTDPQTQPLRQPQLVPPEKSVCVCFPVSRLQKHTFYFPVRDGGNSLPCGLLPQGRLPQPDPGHVLLLGASREPRTHTDCRTATWCFVIFGCVAHKQTCFCLRHERLGRGRREQAWRRTLFLAVSSHLCITHKSVSFLEHSKHNEAQFLVSHSHPCLFYLKVSLQSFEARDQTNKREFGSCNVSSRFCSEVKNCPQANTQCPFWRQFGSI